MNHAIRASKPIRLFTALLIVAQALTTPSVVTANPQGGDVVAGSAVINSASNTLNIATATDRTVINWQSFSIGAGEITNIVQPGANSAVLNRVVTQANPSTIYGQLNSNGNVLLINPSGIIVGPTGVINANGFTASVFDITNKEFLEGGLLNFRGSSEASVINEGQILTGPGGAALLGHQVINQGLITSDGGAITLATGGSITLGDGSRYIQADLATLQNGISETASLINNSGTVRATGAMKVGGEVYLVNPGGNILNDGTIKAQQLTDAKTEGGRIAVEGQTFANNQGKVDASGQHGGGTVTVKANTVLQQGEIRADAEQADAGSVQIDYASRYIESRAAVTSASSQSGHGGTITVSGGDGTYMSGRLQATGTLGGRIVVTGGELTLRGATLDASGNLGGGAVYVGGGYQGLDPNIAHATTVSIGPNSLLAADAIHSGSGGTVVVWSDQQTAFAGELTARGGAAFGNGGLLEVSSAGELAFGGFADASSPNGTSGSLLLDPKVIIIDDVTTTAGNGFLFEFEDPNPNAGNEFGYQVVVLSTGNVVVTSPYDDALAEDAGAVYLFDGSDGTLISELIGSTANDCVGCGGVTVLANGNYVVDSHEWDNGTVTDAGAVTWGDGTTGITGIVAEGNSLVGSHAGDLVGNGGVTALTNGNYVVGSYVWDNGTVTDAGAVTWGDGTTGITGIVAEGNSLVGSQTQDYVGNDGIVALPNGNYVISSPYWNNQSAADAGAVTWADGETGITGIVSAINSLVGSHANDQVGFGGITTLTNGNYVVNSYRWTNGTATKAGAVTWADGKTGITGIVSVDNSLIGPPYQQVGIGGVTALANGNYVVNSYGWDNGSAVATGAVTWGDGTTGITGLVSASNSLVGSQTGDNVGRGGVTALANGNYVVISYHWNNGSTPRAGAVTWGDGTTGTVGVVSTANSLVGSQTNDLAGYGGVTALANGNYVVKSHFWNNGSAVYAGAATWGNGTTGISGIISAANSLVGLQTRDRVGYDGIIALANGNYVVNSSYWNNGSTSGAGAVTWGDGTTGIVGAISEANSLVGVRANNHIGNGGITTLTNGNYVVTSHYWFNGSVVAAGAVTWGDGTTGIAGVVSAANSLVGSQTVDYVGSGGVTALANGDYVVRSHEWDNGTITDAGAVTWGDGTTGITGVVSASNSLVGLSASAGLDTVVEDTVNGTFIARWLDETSSGASGRVRVGSANGPVSATVPNLLFADTPDVTVTISPKAITAVTNTGTQVILQANTDIEVRKSIVTDNPTGDGGDISLLAGRSIQIDAGVAIDTDGGNLSLIANHPAAGTSAGVIDAYRDPGDAVITMGLGSSLAIGAGNLTVQILEGTGLTYNTSGDITLAGVNTTSGNVLVDNRGPGSSGVFGDIGTLDNTAIITSGGGNVTLRSLGDICLLGSIQSDGSGDVNLVAGWDGATGSTDPFNVAAIYAAPTSYGNNAGSVYIGDGTQTAGIAVGSRLGSTSVAAANLTLRASDTTIGGFAQLGFCPASSSLLSVDGDITIALSDGEGSPGDLTLTAGSQRESHVQVGHGTPFGTVDLAGAINLVEVNDITVVGGGDHKSYAQIGHGGYAADGDCTGDIYITRAGNLEFNAGSGSRSYSQLGHGSIGGDGYCIGDITIVQAGEIKFVAGDEDESFAQLGHGGWGSCGDCSGGISISQAGDLEFLAGAGTCSYSQLGHGGYEARGDYAGNISITRMGNLQFVAGGGDQAYSQLGHGGCHTLGNLAGDITVSQAGNLEFTAGNGGESYAQLGHGGCGADGNYEGDISLTQAGNLQFHTGSGPRSYAQLGHGSYYGEDDYSGNITIAQIGNIEFIAGSGRRSFVQLGHGGYRSGYQGEGDFTGDIAITQAGDLTFRAGSGEQSYAQLGHGGLASDANCDGEINVASTGSLELTGQNTTSQYALIGHGGGPGDADSKYSVQGDITLNIAAGIKLTNAFIGHLIDSGSTYASGNTYIAIGTQDYHGTNTSDVLVSDGNSRILSAPSSAGGQLRLYLPRRGSLQMADGAQLNGVDVATFDSARLPNEQGGFTPFDGPYVIDPTDGNFAFYLSVIELIIKANNGSSTYGQVPGNPGLDLIAGVLLDGDTLASIGLTTDFNLTATSDAGTYTINVDGSGLNSNYMLVGSQSGEFVINPAPLTITALNQVKVYGDDLTGQIPMLGTHFTVTGLQNGEIIDTVTLTSPGAPASASPGIYPIVINSPSSGTFDPANYTLAIFHGQLIVAQVSGEFVYDQFVREQDQWRSFRQLFDAFNSTGDIRYRADRKPNAGGNLVELDSFSVFDPSVH